MSEGAHHPAGDQEAVFAFLADPATHGLRAAVKRIDTHAAAVFLAGEHAYKAKRAIRFPFMDFSTLDKRRAGCEAEVAVNRRYAPDLYFGVMPVTRSPGGLRLGGEGEPVEWLVHLRRFDETMTLDHVADRGALTPDLIASVAKRVRATYAEAKRHDGAAATRALREVIEETLGEIGESPELFPAVEATAFAARLRSDFAEVTSLLLDRGRAGWVRRCHGDLHLRNIVLIAGRPTLFDAIEFDEAIATTDILYDFAFLLMDLWERRHRGAANRLLNRYLWGSPDVGAELPGLRLLPSFLALRAAVRAKVDALRFLGVDRSAEARESALRYFAAARPFLAPAPPRLVAIGGLSGTGKTTLAGLLAPLVGCAPGAVHLRSDIERKRFSGVAELARLPESAYGRGMTDQVFAALRAQAEAALAAGHSVIVDAVHRDPGERGLVAEVAARRGVPFTGLWLDAPTEMMVARVSARRGDASDATPAVVASQVKEPLGAIEWHRLDASRPQADLEREASKIMSL